MSTEISVVWNSTLVAVSAVVWSLPQSYLGSGVLHPSESFDKCHSTLDAKEGICPGAYLRWFHSADVAVLIKCSDILGVSSCQMYLA